MCSPELFRCPGRDELARAASSLVASAFAAKRFEPARSLLDRARITPALCGDRAAPSCNGGPPRSSKSVCRSYARAGVTSLGPAEAGGCAQSRQQPKPAPRIRIASSELKLGRSPPSPGSPWHNACCHPSVRPPAPEFRGVPRLAAQPAGVMQSRDGLATGSGDIVPHLRILV